MALNLSVLPWNQDWYEDAYCAWLVRTNQIDPDEWFPPKKGGARRAIQICAQCLIRDKCFQYARENNLLGVWGGRWFGYGSIPSQRTKTSEETMT